jgi:hypothetical protein
MCCGNIYGCPVYGMERGKRYVLDIGMELLSVMACKVLYTYIENICGVIYTQGYRKRWTGFETAIT